MYKGSCHCKNIRFTITGDFDSAFPPLVCYCDHCRKFSLAFGIMALYAPSSVEFEGDITIYTDHTTDSGEEKTVHFCNKCCTLIYTQPKKFGDLICLRTPLIDGGVPEELAPKLELYVEKKPNFLNLSSVIKN